MNGGSFYFWSTVKRKHEDNFDIFCDYVAITRLKEVDITWQ